MKGRRGEHSRPSLEWFERTKQFHTGEAVQSLVCVMKMLRYTDGTPVEIEAWPVLNGPEWWVGDCRGALDHHLGPQGAVGIASADFEKLFGVLCSGDFHFYQLIQPGEDGQPSQLDLDEAAYVVAAASALLQRARYQSFAIKINSEIT